MGYGVIFKVVRSASYTFFIIDPGGFIGQVNTHKIVNHIDNPGRSRSGKIRFQSRHYQKATSGKVNNFSKTASWPFYYPLSNAPSALGGMSIYDNLELYEILIYHLIF